MTPFVGPPLSPLIFALTFYTPPQVLAYLSYADFYRPRYFLLENVRNLVAYNKGLMFRLILRTLLDLGYQVGLGVRVWVRGAAVC